MKKYFTYSLFSFLLHFVLVILCFFSIYFTQEHKNAGNFAKIKAYIYTPQLFSSNIDKINVNNLHTETKTIKTKPNQALPIQPQLSLKHKYSLPRAKTNGEKDKLLVILHDLIQNKVLDLPNNWHNISNKTTTVNFILYPDGHITNLTTVKSCGVAVLDESAENAINAIQPVFAAKELLIQQDSFQIDIVFR